MIRHAMRIAFGAALLVACSDGNEAADELDIARDPEIPEEIILGVDWDHDVYVQPLWQGGKLSYLVINDRAEPVDVFVNGRRDDGSGTGVPEPLAGPWAIGARSHQIFAGDEVQSLYGRLVSWFAGDTNLGLDLLRERPPVSSSAVAVSNHGTNGSGGDSFAQIESDFVVAPGPVFTLTVVMPPGELVVETQTDTSGADASIPVLDVLAVRSERGTVRQTPSGFSVEIPRPTPAWSYAFATDADFTRIELDVALPSGSSEAPSAVFNSWFWSATVPPRSSGNAMVRAFPLAP